MTRERFALLIVSAHLAAATLHGVAHGVLGVPAGSVAGQLFIAVAVYAAPPTALVLLGHGKRVTGAMLMATSMSAALGYGLTFHYFLIASDNIARVPPGFWGWAFRWTAAIIALLEMAGALAGALLLTAHRHRASPGGTVRNMAGGTPGGFPRKGL